jgi:ABC-2 type transport system ATP-binding protein
MAAARLRSAREARKRAARREAGNDGDERATTMNEAERGVGARIEAHALTRRFGGTVALDALSLAIEPGETFALLGANGAGKTTFIRLVTGFLVPSAGRVRVDGLSPVTDAAAVHARIGYVTETTRLYPELRVRGFLRFAGAVHGLRGDALDAAIERVLDRFALAALSERIVGNLSKGTQQRVSLAQAFLHEPTLLIADEPTSGLDPAQQSDVRALLAELRGRRTVILCTHQLEEARALAGRVGVLRRGRLEALGTPEAVLGADAPLHLFRPEPGRAGRVTGTPGAAR